MATIFVGNLSPDVTEHELRTVFEEFGKVTSVKMVTRRRLAYIEMDSDGANAAVEGLRGKQIQGRTMDVAIDTRGGRGGRGGRGRR